MRLDQGALSKIMRFLTKNVKHVPVVSQESHQKIRVNDITVDWDDHLWCVRRRGIQLQAFRHRSWAVAYAVALASGNREVHEFLSDSERRLGKLITDRDLYGYHRNQASKRRDDFKRSVIEGRLSRTNREILGLLDDAKQVLRYQRLA